MNLDETWPIDMCASTDSNTVPARNSRNAAGWAWVTNSEYCPDILRNGDEVIANMMEQIYLQPRFESPMPTITPLQLPYSSGLPSNAPNSIMDGLEIDPVARDGTSFDTTLPSSWDLLIGACYPVRWDIIAVLFTAQDHQRTIGLRASFALNTPPFGSRISPHIKTLNVVPVGSSIIKSVMQNDLEGAKELFAEGQASPLDVDPKANSLLHTLTRVSVRHSPR